MPKVSVVTALSNRSRFLVPRVESILAQTLRDFEWIVIDDRSTDGSFEQFHRLTRSDRRVLLLRNAANLGQGPTTRKAYELARGEYVYVADAADACDPTLLERLTALLDRRPEVGLAYCSHASIDAEGGIRGARPRGRSRIRSGAAEFRALLRASPIRSPSGIIRRAAALRARVFETFVPPTYVDYHCCLKTCLVADAAFLAEPLAYDRLHPAQTSQLVRARRFRRACRSRNSFELIADLFAHVPDDRQSLRGLESKALWHAAENLRPIFASLSQRGMVEHARALEEVVRRRVPEYPVARLHPGPLSRARRALREARLHFARRATSMPPARPERTPSGSAAPSFRPSGACRDGETAVRSACIVVCVRDQAGALDACLDRLARLQAPERAEVEIIVVDNGSSDDAAAVVERHRSRSPFPLHYALEPVAGLSRARNRGVRSSRSDVLAFLDADCLAASDWIARICAEFDADPDASIVGGRVELHDPRDRRVTIKGTRHYQTMTAAEPAGRLSSRLQPRLSQAGRRGDRPVRRPPRQGRAGAVGGGRRFRLPRVSRGPQGDLLAQLRRRPQPRPANARGRGGPAPDLPDRDRRGAHEADARGRSRDDGVGSARLPAAAARGGSESGEGSRR